MEDLAECKQRDEDRGKDGDKGIDVIVVLSDDNSLVYQTARQHATDKMIKQMLVVPKIVSFQGLLKTLLWIVSCQSLRETDLV